MKCPSIADYTVWGFRIVEGRMVACNCLRSLHLNLVDSCLIRKHSTSPFFNFEPFERRDNCPMGIIRELLNYIISCCIEVLVARLVIQQVLYIVVVQRYFLTP